MINKLKARFCVRGDTQHLDAMATTYAPVVDWGTVRLLFTLSVAHQLPTKQIDFRNAFVQSSLPEPINLELSQGFDSDGKVLKVEKSLYGDKRAPKLWFEHLRDNLICDQLGFRQSKSDPCLFLKDGIAFITYVNDGIFVATNSRLIDDTIRLLQSRGLDLDEEEDYAGYLGIDVQRQPDGSIHLLQTGLIDQILTNLDLQDSPKTKDTPAAGPLGPFKESQPLRAPWNYRSVIGKLFYLGNNTRSDIAFANHQCARFSNDPREPHGTAVNRIAMYPKKTRTLGTIIKPNNKELTLDCYCDAILQDCLLWKAQTTLVANAHVPVLLSPLEDAGRLGQPSSNRNGSLHHGGRIYCPQHVNESATSPPTYSLRACVVDVVDAG
jgi:hypothetical protein